MGVPYSNGGYTAYLPDFDEDGYHVPVNTYFEMTVDALANLNSRLSTVETTYVKLQASYPGTAQTGHIHVTGDVGADGTLRGAAAAVSGAASVGSLAATTSVSAGTTVGAGGNIYSTSGSIRALGSYVEANTYLQAGTFVQAGSYLAATTYVQAGTYGLFGTTLTNAGNAAFVTGGTGNVNVNAALGTGGARFNVWDTSEQMRLIYGGGVYAAFAVDSSGVLSITPTGAIIRPGTGVSIRSNPFTSGVSGWNVTAAGKAEFLDVLVRGELRASVFTIGEMNAVGGTIVLSKFSTTLNADFTVPGSVGGTVAGVQIKKSPAGNATVAANDIVWIKVWDGSAIRSLYFTVNGSPAVDNSNPAYSVATLTLQSGSTGGTIRAGTAVVNLGPTTGYTYMSLSSDGTIGSAANLTIVNHAGSPWTTQTARLRLGNLNGTFDYVSDVYGLIAGNDIGSSAASFKGFALDETAGVRLYNASLAQYSAGVQTVSLVSSGKLALGTNISAAGTTTFLVSPTGGAHGSDTLAAGAVLIGPNTGPNLLWDGTSVRMRVGTVTYGEWVGTSFTVGRTGNSLTRIVTDDTNGFRVIRRDGSGADHTVYTVDTTGLVRGGEFAFNLPGWSIDSTNGFAIYVAGVAIRLQVDTSGNLRMKNSGGTDVIVLDSSGASYFAGPMTISTAGGIWNGTGTFASPTTGIKIWAPSSTTGKVAGYNGGTIQVYIDTDGKLYAGAGSVIADANGLTLVPTVASTAIRWAATPTSANYYGIVDATTDGTYNVLQLASGFPSGSNKNSVLSLTALSSSTTGAATRDVRIQLRSTGAGGSWVEIGSVAAGFGGVILGDVTGTAPTSGTRLDTNGGAITTRNAHIYMSNAYNSLSAGSYAFIGMGQAIGNFSLGTGVRFYRGTGENYTAILASIDSTFVGEVASFKGNSVRFEVPWLLHNGNGYYLQLHSNNDAYLVQPAAGTFHIAYTGSIVRWWDSTQAQNRGFQLNASGEWVEVNSGAKLNAASQWTNASDRNLKTDWKAIDLAALEKAFRAKVPVWNYRMKPTKTETPKGPTWLDLPTRHIGPFAQDFIKLGVGDDERTISSSDGIGVALALLHRAFDRMDAMGTEIERLEAQLAGKGK